jgi:hypothetical protein
VPLLLPPFARLLLCVVVLKSRELLATFLG